MQKVCSSNPPVVTGICDPNKSWAQHHCSFKLGLKLKYLNKSTAINNTVVINKKASKIQKFVEMFFVGIGFFWKSFCRITFFGMVFVTYIISSHVITESSIILARYLSFSQAHVAGFQM